MLSIVIPSFNTEAYLSRCIESILKYPPKSEFEIIVVDNASTDGTVATVRRQFPSATVLNMGFNSGFSKACNAGAKLAQGEYLLFLNSDTEVLERSFDEMIQWLEDRPRSAVVGPLLVNSQGHIAQMSWGWDPLLTRELLQKFLTPSSIKPAGIRAALIRRLQKRPRTVEFICGACLMVRADVFRRLNGFDEQYELYFEDADLCRRVRDAGGTVEFLPKARVIHHLGQSPKREGLIPLIFQQSHLAYYRRHAGPMGRLLLRVYLLLKCLLWWLKGLILPARRSSLNEQAANLYEIVTGKRSFKLDRPLI
jgi:GT2 family glycosyltransferase